MPWPPVCERGYRDRIRGPGMRPSAIAIFNRRLGVAHRGTLSQCAPCVLRAVQHRRILEACQFQDAGVCEQVHVQ